MPKKKLTYKQKKFVNKYIENEGNGTKSAKETYACKNDNTANQISIENLRKPTIRESIEEACQAMGLDSKKVLGEISWGINKRDKNHPKYIDQAKAILGMDAVKETKLDASVKSSDLSSDEKMAIHAEVLNSINGRN